MPQDGDRTHAQRGVEVVIPEFKYREPDLDAASSASVDQVPFGTPDALAINKNFESSGRHETGQDFFLADTTDLSEASMGTFLSGLLGTQPTAAGVPTVELDEMSMEVPAEPPAAVAAEATFLEAPAPVDEPFFAMAPPTGNEQPFAEPEPDPANELGASPFMSEPPVAPTMVSPVIPPKGMGPEPVKFDPLPGQSDSLGSESGMGDLLAVVTITAFEADLILNGPPAKKSGLFRR